MSEPKYQLTPEQKLKDLKEESNVDKDFYDAIEKIEITETDEVKKFLLLHSILTSSIGFEMAIERVLSSLYLSKSDPKIMEAVSRMTAEQMVNDLGYTLSNLSPDLEPLQKKVEKMWKELSDRTLTIGDFYKDQE